MIITKISNSNDWNILWNEYIGYRRAFEDKNNSDLHSRHINIKLELCHNHAQHMLLEYVGVRISGDYSPVPIDPIEIKFMVTDKDKFFEFKMSY